MRYAGFGDGVFLRRCCWRGGCGRIEGDEAGGERRGELREEELLVEHLLDVLRHDLLHVRQVLVQLREVLLRARVTTGRGSSSSVSPPIRSGLAAATCASRAASICRCPQEPTIVVGRVAAPALVEDGGLEGA